MNMNKIKKFIKDNLFLSIALVLLFIIVIIILVSFLRNNDDTNINGSNIKLSGYYYENVEKNSFSQDTYYFEKDGTCFIKHKSLTSSASTLVLDESYTHCTFNVNDNNLIVNIYDSNYYNKLVDTKTYTIDTIDDGIKLNNVEFLNQNYENIVNFQENFIENYSLTCASKVAKQLGVSNYCTTWEKVSDGFYNYSCGITIRTIVDDVGISYDTYNSTSGQFSTKNYCYKIVKNKEKEMNVSNTIITKEVPLKIMTTGNLASNYKIQSVETNVNQVSITGYQYRLDNINVFPVYINIDNLSTAKELKVKVNNPIYAKDVDLDEIVANVIIDELKTKEIVLNSNEINVRNVNNNLRASLAEPIHQIIVKINGTTKTLDELENITAYIDLKEYIKTGIYEVDLKINLDESFYDYTIEPSKIKIKIS